MAAPRQVAVTIDGTRFDAFAADFQVYTRKDEIGQPEMGTQFTSVKVYADPHDTDNIPFSTLQQLFELSNIVTQEKIVPMLLEFWVDEKQEDVICSIEFQGWISFFNLLNPLPGSPLVGGSGGGDGLNHALCLELTPTVNESNYKEIKMGN